MVSDGWDESADAWIAFVDAGDPNRELLLDPVMLKLCGGLEGVRVLDVGCGEGRFARRMAARGAMVTGIDPTDRLIEVARIRGGGPTYDLGIAETLPYEDAAFDLVVSYVQLVDVPDYRTAIFEMARVLRLGGNLVVSNLNGFVTSVMTGWHRDAAGNKLHYPVDRYFEERPEPTSWQGIEIVNWHRPLSSYMKAFLDAGLLLRDFREPWPSNSAIDQCARLRDSRRLPFFFAAKWEKP